MPIVIILVIAVLLVLVIFLRKKFKSYAEKKQEENRVCDSCKALYSANDVISYTVLKHTQSEPTSGMSATYTVHNYDVQVKLKCHNCSEKAVKTIFVQCNDQENLGDKVRDYFEHAAKYNI